MNLPPFIDIPPVRHNNEKETTYLVPYAQSNIPGFPDTEGNLSDTTDEIRVRFILFLSCAYFS